METLEGSKSRRTRYGVDLGKPALGGVRTAKSFRPLVCMC